MPIFILEEFVKGFIIKDYLACRMSADLASGSFQGPQ